MATAGGGVSREQLARLRELKAHLRALGDVVRLRIVALLATNGEMGVTELVRALRISQPLVSWHLGVLRRTGVVKVRRQGRQVRYSLDREQFRARQQQLARLVEKGEW